MKKFFKKILVYLFVSLLILTVYGLFCECFFGIQKYFPNDSKRAWSMKQQSQQYDYAVLGSSRAEEAFDMLLLDSLIQEKGINIGCNGSGYVDNYLVLNKFLQNKNTIKTLFLQVDIYSLDPEHNFSNSFHVYNFLPFWHDTIFKSAISHYLSSSDQMVFNYAPWMRFYVYNKYFSPIEVIRRLKQNSYPEKKRFDKPTWYFSTPELKTDSSIFFKKGLPREIKIQPFDVEYLKRILELAKANNIQVVLFTSPDFILQEKVFSNYFSTKNSLDSLLVPYSFIRFEADDSLRNNIALFKDPAHLNGYGKFLHTKSFADKYWKFVKRRPSIPTLTY